MEVFPRNILDITQAVIIFKQFTDTILWVKKT